MGGSMEYERPRVITLEAPEVLDLQENFFNQEPFSRIVDLTHQKTGMEVDSLRSLLHGTPLAAKKALDGVKPNTIQAINAFVDRKSLTEEEINRVAATVSGSDNYAASMKGEFKQGFVNLRAMMKILNKYPYWIPYLDSQQAGYYTKTGHPKPERYGPGAHRLSIPSYAAWVTGRLRREGILKTKGIEDIFPQSLNGASITDVVSPKRTWVILDAAQISKAG